MIATETSCNRPSREKPGEMLNEGSPYPPGESGGKRYITHIDLSCWRVRTGTRASCCSSHGFPACATLYKTVTGVTARYQQVMPKKEEDTPSSGISSSVSPGFRCRRRWFSTNSPLSGLSLAILCGSSTISQNSSDDDPKDKRAGIGSTLATRHSEIWEEKRVKNIEARDATKVSIGRWFSEQAVYSAPCDSRDAASRVFVLCLARKPEYTQGYTLRD